MSEHCFDVSLKMENIGPYSGAAFCHYYKHRDYLKREILFLCSKVSLLHIQNYQSSNFEGRPILGRGCFMSRRILCFMRLKF